MTDWTARYAVIDPRRIDYRIVFNPNYPGVPCGIPGAVAVKIRKAVKPKTRERIRLSIEKEGFRNPIIVYKAGFDIILGFGGGRLQAAKELDKFIPAIIVDYVGVFKDFREVTPDNWKEFFTDVPMHFEFTDVGIYTHYGLERARREDRDPAGTAWTTEEDMPAIYDESPWLDDDGI